MLTADQKRKLDEFDQQSYVENSIRFGKIGIVKTNEGKFYIGLGRGGSQEQDEKIIKEYGAKFTPDLDFFKT